MSRIKLLLLLVSLIVIHQLPAQEYRERIRLLYQGIQTKLRDQKAGLYYETTDPAKNENPHSWLWPLCGLIQAANEMEVLEPSGAYMQPVMKAIDQYYSDAMPVPAYQDYVRKERASSRFYDDNQWVAIACLDAYNRNHTRYYLNIAKMIFRFMESGIDTAAGGGSYWKEGDKTTKNTCSNGPAILVALQLYRITKEQSYLATALQLYQWTNKYLQSPEGTYYDNIKIPSRGIDKKEYTYNTGTMLESNILLYQVTKEQKYLNEAKRIAAAGKAKFFRDGRLPGNYWFNAVLLRGYIALYKVDQNREWIGFFEQDADSIWNTERDATNFLGKEKAKSLIDQAAMIEIYSRLQQMKQKNGTIAQK